MPYATPADVLAALSDADLLAGLAGETDRPAVSGALLRAAITDSDLLAEALPEEQAAAAAAVVRIGEECETAGTTMDGYLAGLGLPPAALLRSLCVDLALRGLLGSRPAREDGPYGGIIRAAKAADDLLRAIRRGDVRYGAAVAGRVVARTEPRLVTMDSLAGM